MGWPDKFSPSPCCSAQVSNDLRLINPTECLQSLPFLTAGSPWHGRSLSLRNSLSRVLRPTTLCLSVYQLFPGHLGELLFPLEDQSSSGLAPTGSPRAPPHAPMAPGRSIRRSPAPCVNGSPHTWQLSLPEDLPCSLVLVPKGQGIKAASNSPNQKGVRVGA